LSGHFNPDWLDEFVKTTFEPGLTVRYGHLNAAERQVIQRAREVILIYTLGGFANLGSLGILIGGLGTLRPERRSEIVALGLRSIVAGTFATLMTGAVVGLLGFM
jgi:concentrative nucleoside transporter, CNT family